MDKPTRKCMLARQPGLRTGQMQAADSVMSWLTVSLLAAKADLPGDASQLHDGLRETQRHYFANKGPSSQGYGFSKAMDMKVGP